MPSQFEKRTKKAKVDSQEDAHSPPIEYTRVAYDVVFDETTRQYMKISVSYNPETKEATVKAIEPIADSQALASYKMKEIFAKKIMKIE